MMFRAMCGMMVLMMAGAAMAADSPIDKGSLYLDGSFYFESRSGDLWENYQGDGMSTFSLGSASLSYAYVDVKPTVGFFVSPGVYIGAQIGFQKYSRGEGDDLDVLALGPALGYYAKVNSATEAKGSLYAFGRGYYTFATIGDGDGDDMDMNAMGVNVGLLYMVSSAVGADFSINYQNDSWKDGDGGPSVSGSTIKLGIGLSAFIY